MSVEPGAEKGTKLDAVLLSNHENVIKGGQNDNLDGGLDLRSSDERISYVLPARTLMR